MPLELQNNKKVINEDYLQCNINATHKCMLKKGSEKNYDLENHLESKHNKDNCHYCNNIFRSMQYLVKHSQT